MRKTLVLLTAVCPLLGVTAHAEERLGASYFGSNIPANTTVTIFAGSANTNGASVRTASMAVAGSWASMYLQADYPDGTHHVIYTVQTSSLNETASLPYAISLIPGVGLSVMNLGTQVSGAYITYDLH